MTEQQIVRSDISTDSSQQADEVWRKEIHARVAGYRSRRGRRIEGAYSMRFPFPPAGAEEASSRSEQECCEDDEMGLAEESQPAVAAVAIAEPPLPSSEEADVLPLQPVEAPSATPELAQSPAMSVMPEDDQKPVAPPAPRVRARRKVIAFPRQASAPPEAAYRLADPIVPEQPRILDVPEELEAFPNTPLLDGLQFGPSAQQASAAPADHVELPFQAVRISQRMYAGVIDCALVAIATALFAAVSYKMLPNLALTKAVLLTAGPAPILLWAVYQYVFTMYGGATAGMRWAGIRLTTFKGGLPDWRHRRSRTVGLYFSTASLAMGLLWSLVDVDALCWHDRISRTYLTNRE